MKVERRRLEGIEWWVLRGGWIEREQAREEGKGRESGGEGREMWRWMTLCKVVG